MEISKELQTLLKCSDQQGFTEGFMKSFIADAQTRNPDVISERMLKQPVRPKYNEGIRAINKELESLKIINRRTDVKN